MESKAGEFFYYDAPEGEDVDFECIVIRRLRKKDERDAATVAREICGDDIDFSSKLMIEQEEKVRLSLVSVNGQMVVQPFMEADEWNTKSWDYLKRAYAEVNGADPKKLESFVGRRVTAPDGKPAAKPSSSSTTTG